MSDNDPIHLRSGGGIAAEHAATAPPQEEHAVLVAPSTGDERNAIRGALRPLACWRLEDHRFDFDSSFIRPQAAAEFRSLAALLARHPGAPLSLFGHADPVGAEDYNKVLSGRRATAVYAMLTRDIGLWERLYANPFSGDNWQLGALDVIRQDLGAEAEGKDRGGLFRAYMDRNCRGPDGALLHLDRSAFLGRGADPGGKGDYQGCSDFNPLFYFSAEEEQRFALPQHREERNEENAPNRRVLAFIFRRGAAIDPGRWPCPRTDEGTAGCRRRLWSDAAPRQSRRLPTERRTTATTGDTFACRFYERIADGSPCEGLRPPWLVQWLAQRPTTPPDREAALVVQRSDGQEVARLGRDAAQPGPGAYEVYDLTELERHERLDLHVKVGEDLLFTGFRMRLAGVYDALLRDDEAGVLRELSVPGPLAPEPPPAREGGEADSEFPYDELGPPPGGRAGGGG